MSPLYQCRLCGAPLTRTFVDLGMSPLCESYVPEDRLDEAELFYPLHVRLCEACLLVQLPAYVPGEDIFSDYAYFSSYSDSWVAHAKRYAQEMIGRIGLTRDSLVTEVASNDGYLLQHFAAQGIPVLGVEPAAKPRMSGTWAKTLFPATRSARPCCWAISWPVSGPRNRTSVGMPRARAASATLAAGSTPRTGIPRAAKCCRR